MKQMIGMMVAVASTAVLADVADPQISNVTVSQDPASRRVKVSYRLDEQAIVTMDVLTNGVSIGGQNIGYVRGDCNKLVEAGTRTLTWAPHKSWPDHKFTEPVVSVKMTAWAKDTPPDYMVVSLVTPNSVRYFPSAEQIPGGGVTNDIYKTEYIVLRKCPAANVEWRMGSPTTELGRSDNEVPHQVTLGNDFYIGVYPVTRHQYLQLVPTGGAGTFTVDGATRPIESAVIFNNTHDTDWPSSGHSVSSWTFIGQLQAISGMPNFDLPLEAQWEFACRAGTGSALYSGKELSDKNSCAEAGEIGRCGYNCKSDDSDAAPEVGGTAKVGSYPQNAWGIYDMCGNVLELCLDYYQDDLTGVDPNVGPINTGSNSRVVRGGSYDCAADRMRSAWRVAMDPAFAHKSIGFRIAYHLGN